MRYGPGAYVGYFQAELEGAAVRTDPRGARAARREMLLRLDEYAARARRLAAAGSQVAGLQVVHEHAFRR